MDKRREKIAKLAREAGDLINDREAKAAIKCYEDAIHLLNFSDLEERIDAAGLRIRLGDLWNLQPDGRDRAAFLFARGLKGAGPDGISPAGRARATSGLGISLWFRQQVKESAVQFSKALTQLRSLDKPPTLQLAETHRNYGLSLSELGQFDLAEAQLKTALQISEHGNLAEQLMLAKRQLANVWYKFGRFSSSSELIESIAPGDADDPADWVNWLNLQASLDRAQGRFDRAQKHFRKAVEWLYKTGDNKSDFAGVLTNAAQMELQLGHVQDAETLADLSEALLHDRSPLSAHLGYIQLKATIAKTGKNYDIALEHWLQADALVADKAQGDRNRRSDIACEIADLLVTLDRRPEALDILAPYCPPGHWNAFQPEHVEPLWRRAELLRHDGQIGSAIALIKAAFVVEAGRGKVDMLWRLYATTAALASSQRNEEAAIFWGKLAVDQINASVHGFSDQSSERRFIIDECRASFDALHERLVACGRIPEAEHTQDLMKLDHIHSFAGRERTQDPRKSETAKRDDERRLNQQLIALRKQFDDQSRKVLDWSAQAGSRREAKSELAKARDEFGAFFDKVFTYFAEEKSKELPTLTGKQITPAAGTARLNFIAGTERLFIRAFESNRSELFEQPVSREELYRSVYDLRAAIKARKDPGEVAGLSRAVFDAVMAPVHDWLSQDVSHLDISVYDRLSYLPFACLHSGAGYLVERYSTSVVTPVEAEAKSPTKRRDWCGAAFAALCDFPGYERLDYAAGEVDQLCRQHPRAGTPITNANFTKQRLIATLRERPDFVHIASHFQFEAGDVRKSHLLLGDGRPLTLWDFNELDVDLSSVRLLFLAMCSSGTVERAAGELESLAGLFQTKGVRDVIASAWPVYDLASPALTASFYEELFSRPGETSTLGEPSVASCLQHAQCSLLHGSLDVADGAAAVRGLSSDGRDPLDFSNPYYWGSFVHFAPG